MNVKVFRLYKSEDSSSLERKINDFLDKSRVDVLEIHTAAVDDSLYVLIEYEEAPDDKL